VVAAPEMSEEAFRDQCKAAAEEKKNEEMQAVEARYEKLLDKLEDRLQKETSEFERDKAELGHRRLEEVGKGIENVVGMFVGRRRSISTSLTKRRMTSKARTALESSEKDIKKVEEEMKKMETDLLAELQKVSDRWDGVVDEVVELPVSPFKKDIFTELFGLLWLPYYAFEMTEGWLTIPAFDWGED